MMRCLTALLGSMVLALLTGCDMALPPLEVEAPAARAAPQPETPITSAESRALRTYYARVQSSLLAQDLLRTDGGGPDAPYSAEMLTRNFQRIALYEEYARIGNSIIARQTPSRLHRWEVPVRLSVEFGDTVPRETQIRDRREIENFVSRIGRVTGHPIKVVNRGANFHVFVVDEDARLALGPRLRQIIPSISPGAVAAVTNLPRTSYCLVFAWDPEDDGTYAKAVAIIRAEHPDLLRLSCIHEEIAQGMGLSNDSPQARPSVFNDDEEFGLLTSHDEELLSILYDPRLRPGMRAAEAMPIVEQIVLERPGGRS